jgi:hypothetical protein
VVARISAARAVVVRPAHVTLRDPALPHQVILQHPAGGGPVVVSCNCLRKRLRRGGVGYTPIGEGPDLVAARALYNDPANHRKPFDPEADGAKW